MKLYLIDDEEVSEDEFNERLEEAVSNECEEGYDEMLDDAYGEIEICGYSYAASFAFNEVDQMAYRCGFNDYVSSVLSDDQYGLNKNEMVYRDGLEFKIKEEDEDDDEGDE